MSLVRRVARKLDLQAFRLVAPAYLLLLGASLAILPTGRSGAVIEGRAAFGLATFLSGLVLLWLGAIHFTRHRASLACAALAILQGGYGLAVMVNGGLVVGAGLILTAAGILVLGPSRARVRPDPDRRPDLLVAILAAVNVVQGLAILGGVDEAARILAESGVAPTPAGATLLATGVLVLATQLRPSLPRWLDWLAAAGAGGSLLAVAIVAAVRIDPIYWLVGLPAFLRAGVLLAHPLWQPRLGTIDWHSIRTKITAALVTAGTVPLFTFILGDLYAPGGGPVSTGTREATFGAFALVLLVTYAVAWAWGSGISRAHRRVAAAVATLRPGRPWQAPPGRLDPELRTITDTVEHLSATLAEEKSATERRLRIASAGQLALSSSLNLEVVAERLLDALVPAFCDSSVVYVREGDGMRRLAVRVPEGLPVSEHSPATAEGMGPDAVLRTGQPQLYLDGVPPGYYAGLSTDPDHERLILAMRISSLMLVPIVSSHGVLGVLSAALHGGRRRFTPPDAAALLDLAARAALSIENARLFEELTRASAVKDEFLGLVSHELKTPMTTILGNALLLRRAPDAAARERLLQDLEADAERMAGIVDNLLALARFEVVERELLEPTALYAVVRRCVDDMARANPEREITAEIEGRPIVEANAEQLDMVMRNLLGNALKYSPRGQPVAVEVRCENDRATVLVLDRGPGIDHEEAGRLFDAFYRSGSTGDRVTGLGVGLAVCRRIVESLGGEVMAAPRAGGGSIFGFWVPLVPVDEVGPADQLVGARSALVADRGGSPGAGGRGDRGDGTSRT